MFIKTRLSFQFTLIVAALLLFFSAMVYYFSYSGQLNKFRDYLHVRAENNATLLINVAEVDSTLLMKIHKSTISLEEEELAITDSSFNLLYGNNLKFLSDETIRNNFSGSKVAYFSIDKMDGVYFKHHYNNHTYNVYVIAFDKSRREYLSELQEILFWSILVSICLSVIFAYFFSNKAIKPISDIVKSVKEINSLKLGNRLDEGNRKDEIAQLAMTFNEMLSNLEVAFKNQEDFVSNASHEIRTPLAIMIAESDYINNRNVGSDEYKKHLEGVILDLRKLNNLLNNLLELAQINNNKNIQFSDVRIDEVIFNSISQTKAKYSSRKIIPVLNYPENGRELIIKGNEGLLIIAFNNLLDNACKFSNSDVLVNFNISDEHIGIVILDKGLGIPRAELESIFNPFKRGENVKFISGYGVGLTLVARIFNLHHTEIFVNSTENEGTKIECIFRRTAPKIVLNDSK